MNTKTTFLVAILISILSFTSLTSKAQMFRVGGGGYNALVVGDFSKTEFSNNSAAYGLFGYGGHITAQFFLPSNFGFGIRFNSKRIQRDYDTYKTDLLNHLGVMDDNYSASLPFAYTTVGFSLGASYIFKLGTLFELEPYFFLGTNTMLTPGEQVVFFDGTKTNTYRKEANAYVGFTYTPGFKFQWNITDLVGVNLFFEYEGMNMIAAKTDNEIIYSNDSFTKIQKDKEIKPTSFNGGFGFTFSFGQSK